MRKKDNPIRPDEPPLVSLKDEFMRPGNKGIIPVKPEVQVLSCREVCGGCLINGTFIASGDRLAAADFLLRRGGFK